MNDLRARLVGDDQIAAAAIRTGRPLRWRIEPRDEHLLFWLGRGSAHLRGAASDAGFGPGTPMILSASEPFELTVSVAETMFVVMSDAFVRSGAEVLNCESDLILFERSRHDIDPTLLSRHLARGLPAAVLDGVDRHGERVAARQFLSVVLAAFPQREPIPPRPSRLETTKQYVTEHAAEPIGVSDIAEATRISIRGLQQLFRRELDTTPLGFLRAVRLDGIRGDLIAAGPDRTVGEIARAWQIQHLGRLSAAYRDRFGELPSTTMRERPKSPPAALH